MSTYNIVFVKKKQKLSSNIIKYTLYSSNASSKDLTNSETDACLG